MSRPVGVTVSAIVAILGSILSLVMAVLMVSSLFMDVTATQPPNTRPIVIATAVMFAVFGVLGLWTSVGLFRLRQWARTSTLVFAGVLAVTYGLGLLVMTVMPLPSDVSASTSHTVRLVMVAITGIPFAIGVWWLFQFNRPSTKAAFASPIPETPSLRPLSITIIGWFGIIGGASCLFSIMARLPAFLFGMTINGWIAGVIYALFGALSLYIGKGLLDLRERARVLAIGWYMLGFLHMSIVTLVPSVRQRMVELQQTFGPEQKTPMPFDQGILVNVTFAFSAILIAVTIWFLVRNRPAFVRAENP
jgi:hypothetical protein